MKKEGCKRWPKICSGLSNSEPSDSPRDFSGDTNTLRLICTLVCASALKMSLQDVISCPRFVGLTARPRAAIRSDKVCRRTGGLRSSFSTAVLSWRHGVGRLRRTVARPAGALGGVVEQASDSPHKFRASRTLVRYPPRRASSDKAGADIMSYRTFSSARTE